MVWHPYNYPIRGCVGGKCQPVDWRYTLLMNIFYYFASVRSCFWCHYPATLWSTTSSKNLTREVLTCAPLLSALVFISFAVKYCTNLYASEQKPSAGGSNMWRVKGWTFSWFNTGSTSPIMANFLLQGLSLINLYFNPPLIAPNFFLT